MPAEVEGELWFSDVVASAGPLGISLDPGIADLLRAELAAVPAERHRAWHKLQEWHGRAPWSIRLEERINYLSTFRDAEADEIAELLAAAVERLRAALEQDESRAIGIARWLLAASARLPTATQSTTAAAAAAVAAGAHLDGRVDGAEALAPEDRTRWLSWLLDSLGAVSLPLQLVQGGLAVGGDLSRSRPSLRIPATDPLAISVLWRSDGVERQTHVQLRRGEERYVATSADELELRTVSGDGVVVRPAGVGTIRVTDSRGVERTGRGFAVTPDVVLTTVSVSGESPDAVVQYVPRDGEPIACSLEPDVRLGIAALRLSRRAPAVMPVAGFEAVATGARWRLEAAPDGLSGIVSEYSTAVTAASSLIELVPDPASPPIDAGVAGAAVTLDAPWGAVIGLLQSIRPAASDPDKPRPQEKLRAEVLSAVSVDAAIERFGLRGRTLTPARPTRPSVTLDATAPAPDITLAIATQSEGGQSFACRVSTPLLDGWQQRVEQWSLGDEYSAVVASFVDEITRRVATPEVRRATLRGAGLELWGAAPPLFRQLYWELVDTGRPPRTILIASEMIDFPWEILIPRRSDLQHENPLGVECAIGCWLTAGAAPPHFVPLTDSYVIAPRYRGSRELPGVEREVEYVMSAFSGQRVAPASLRNIDETLARAGASLIHFAGHAQGERGQYAFMLDGDEMLRDFQLAALEGLNAAMRSRRPFVFLNAAPQEPFGANQMARRLLQLGAGSVVAPMWAVRDETASAVALEFYRRTADDPRRPFADIFGELRRHASDAEADDSWLAYRFYGDPHASQA